MYDKDIYPVVFNFCAANQEAQISNTNCFSDISFKEISPNTFYLLDFFGVDKPTTCFFLFADVSAEGPSPPKRPKFEGIFITKDKMKYVLQEPTLHHKKMSI